MFFRSVKFKNFKALKQFTIKLNDFNVLVGPNNAGKSTILSAFKILNEGIKTASQRKPEVYIDKLMYKINLDNLSISSENVFTNYEDDDDALIEFTLSNGSKLILLFPQPGQCFMYCDNNGKTTTTPSQFKTQYPVRIGFVPILGPVEQREKRYQKEAARQALLNNTASRNFRNIWYHYPDGFDEFKQVIKESWPGMDIEKPAVDNEYAEKPILYMMCPEERYPREIFWAGFGFQVWCQLITFILKSQKDTILIIDEPDIYLHSDLQRQLISILKSIDVDILIATHSTEILAEVEPSNILIVDKKLNRAKNIKNPVELLSIYQSLGSSLNPIITQIAKTKKILFVEGKDFKIISNFAKILGMQRIVNRSEFAVVPAEGFNKERVKDFIRGMEYTIGQKLSFGVIFDRDYRCDIEITEIKNEFREITDFFIIHDRKEIENYLIVPDILLRCIASKVKDVERRSDNVITFNDDINSLINRLSIGMKSDLIAKYLTNRKQFEQKKIHILMNQR